MAVLAGPLIEVVAGRVLMALGAVVAGGAAAEAARERARKRQEEAERARSAALAKTEALSKDKEKCKECPPDQGALTPVNHHMSPNSIAYQAKISGFPPGMEWRFEGKDFDGFQSSLCLLKEAKADYDQFFDEDREFRYFFQKGIFTGMQYQAQQQALIVRKNPPAALTYYFQTPVACSHMRPLLTVLGITVLYAP